MILRALKLHHIRSYTDEEFSFPSGRVLLSGDIGSGKSTILLAIEFALFGIMRSGLSGTSLLRHGTNTGYVELSFAINDNIYVIKRTLKRGKKSVTQDSGYIFSDGSKFEGTPVELKARILEIIGYPEELLTKSKSLIYRFTVYTPQEDMKQILFEDKDVRLDTLRKIFGIDKYKKIRENAVLFIREIKKKQNDLNIRLESYDEYSEDKKEKTAKLNEINLDIKDKKVLIDSIKIKIDEQKNNVLKFEEQIKKINEIKKNIELKEVLINSKNKSKNDSQIKFKQVTQEIKNYEDKLELYKEIIDKKSEKKFEDKLNLLQEKHSILIKDKTSLFEKKEFIGIQIKNLNEEITTLKDKSKDIITIKTKLDELKLKIDLKSKQESQLQEMLDKEQKYQLILQKNSMKISQSNTMIENVKIGQICPTCDQEIDEKHKNEVINREKKNIEFNTIEKTKVNEVIIKISTNISKIKNNLTRIRELELTYNKEKESLIMLEESSKQLNQKQINLSRLYEEKKVLDEKKLTDDTKVLNEISNLNIELSKNRDHNNKFREKENLIQSIKKEKNNLEELVAQNSSIENVIKLAESQITELRSSLTQYKDINEEYSKQKTILDELNSNLNNNEVIFATISQEYKSISEQIDKINQRLQALLVLKKKVEKYSQIQNWFDSFFVKLMSTMEKHIMVSIHREFSMLLKDWFNILIDDIDIELDDEFSPKIIQNGYETEVESLSGGEKTSVALAYRLALNKVINDLIQNIQTKDLIILDEPTDGFSTEQLDKVRDVLEQLNMKQTIIVSHEPKMESYVENIIRVNKSDGVSSVTT
jgi:DNA repair protein SbcC/Rad50